MTKPSVTSRNTVMVRFCGSTSQYQGTPPAGRSPASRSDRARPYEERALHTPNPVARRWAGRRGTAAGAPFANLKYPVDKCREGRTVRPRPESATSRQARHAVVETDCEAQRRSHRSCSDGAASATAPKPLHLRRSALAHPQCQQICVGRELFGRRGHARILAHFGRSLAFRRAAPWAR